jgi:hypothetical protein
MDVAACFWLFDGRPTWTSNANRSRRTNTMATTQQKEAKSAAEAMEVHASPQHEHHWLEKLVGDWRVEGKAMTPFGEEKTHGEESVRSVDGLWFIAEGEGEMPGGNQGTTILTLGYDTMQGKYVGTFIGSMMTNQWVYEGELDENEKVLVLDTMGPDFTEKGIGEKLVPYQDTIEFIDDDHRVLKSHKKGKDGRWEPFVEVHYYRKTDGASRR